MAGPGCWNSCRRCSSRNLKYQEVPFTKDDDPTAPEPAGRLTTEERAALRERARELRGARGKEDGEEKVLAKIAALDGRDRAVAEQIHAIVRESAPNLSPKLWYGMPAYARDGHVVCFFQSAQKFKTRYATLGFSDHAQLDDGTVWPTAFALTELTAGDVEWIQSLVRRAVNGPTAP